METRFLYGSRIKDKDILDDVSGAFNALDADLDCLDLGVFPDGTPIARHADIDWAGIMVHGLSDMEQTRTWSGIDYNAVAENDICAWCDANRGSRPYTHLVDDPPWQLRTNDAFIALTRDSCPHPMNCAHWWTRHFMRVDLMHALDHRGVSGIVAAGVISDIIDTRYELGATRELRMQAIDNRRLTWYSNHRVSSKMPKLFF